MENVKTILWLDDDLSTPALRTEIDELLSRGFQIIPTENPDEFFTALKTGGFSCIVLDITLPLGDSIETGEANGGMRTGLVLLQRIMESEKPSGVPIVVYTIVEDQDVIAFCKDNSIPYINKFEVLPKEFVNALENVFKKKADPTIGQSEGRDNG